LLPEDIGKCKIAVGVRQSLRAVLRGQADSVFVADDAAPVLKKELLENCMKNNVPVHTIDTMENLGNYAGIQVGAVACVLLR